VSQASESYHIVYGSWPTGFAELYAEYNSNHFAFLPDWRTTNDAWGRPLDYKPFAPGLGYGTVVSLGRDGKPEIEERFQ